MIIPKPFLSEIFLNLGDENYIVNTNVRRINKKDIKADFDDMVSSSISWNKVEDNTQYFNQFNGGVQVYSKDFWTQVGGIPESLGKYWGAEDNYLWYVARMRELTMIDISTPLLHIEHKGSLPEKVTPEEKNTITEWYWSGSLHAFARVCNLRCKTDTQKETRDVADQIDIIAREHFPISWKYLRSH
jgi:hypothetical protein